MNRYRIVLYAGQLDSIAGQSFATYDEAYVVLGRYNGHMFCSDERDHCSIEEASGAEALADGHPS